MGLRDVTKERIRLFPLNTPERQRDFAKARLLGRSVRVAYVTVIIQQAERLLEGIADCGPENPIWHLRTIEDVALVVSDSDPRMGRQIFSMMSDGEFDWDGFIRAAARTQRALYAEEK